jgi:hypothetical protein
MRLSEEDSRTAARIRIRRLETHPARLPLSGNIDSDEDVVDDGDDVIAGDGI